MITMIKTGEELTKFNGDVNVNYHIVFDHPYTVEEFLNELAELYEDESLLPDVDIVCNGISSPLCSIDRYGIEPYAPEEDLSKVIGSKKINHVEAKSMGWWLFVTIYLEENNG